MARKADVRTRTIQAPNHICAEAFWAVKAGETHQTLVSVELLRVSLRHQGLDGYLGRGVRLVRAIAKGDAARITRAISLGNDWRATLRRHRYRGRKFDDHGLCVEEFRLVIQRNGLYKGRDLKELRVWMEFVNHYAPPGKL